MKIFLSHTSERWLFKQSAELQNRIIEKLIFISYQPNPLNFAKCINKKLFRFRIGDYRAIFVVEQNEIHIASIERRDKAYD
jgi:mRNA-degrading endonuclease RelE of RelBE toxin-antitoxin system